jgi:hypothetical protein
MTHDVVLLTLSGLFAVANSVVARRYARQAKAASERAAAAASQAQAERQRSTESGRKQVRPGPAHLTYEQLLPVANAIRRRESAVRAGAGLCPPFPGCPACGQQPTEMTVFNDHPSHFLEDKIVLAFSPCGHRVAADAGDLYRAMEQP